MFDIYNQFKEFKIFEVAFMNSDKELQRLFCSVKSIEHNSVVISANNQRNKNIFAKVGDQIQIHIYTENGIYSAVSRVLVVNKGSISTEYIIAYPTNSKHSQRREYFRAEIPVKFRLTVSYEDENKQPFIILSTTKNICGKGLSYISQTPILEYSKIEVELFFEENLVKSEAELVYTKHDETFGKQAFINAFTLTTISKKDIEFIIKKCFLHQLQLRKNPEKYKKA